HRVVLRPTQPRGELRRTAVGRDAAERGRGVRARDSVRRRSDSTGPRLIRGAWSAAGGDERNQRDDQGHEPCLRGGGDPCAVAPLLARLRAHASGRGRGDCGVSPLHWWLAVRGPAYAGGW